MRLNLDVHSSGDSWIHRWQPKQKLIGLGGVIFAFASVHDLRLVPAMLMVTGVFYASSNLPISFLLNRLRYPGLFLFGMVSLLPFLSGETVIWQWGFLSLYKEGGIAVALIAARFFSILTLGLILLATTRFVVLIQALRSLGLPPVLADMTLLSYRYLYDTADNLATMQTAMRLRGFGQSRKWFFLHPNWQALKQLAALAGTLLIRSYEQSEQVYQAMRLRGYGVLGAGYRGQGMGYGGAGEGGKCLISWSTIALWVTLLVAAGFVIAEILL